MRTPSSRLASVGLAAAVVASLAVTAPAVAEIQSPVGAVGTYDNGGAGATEIVAHDPFTQRLYLTNGEDGSLTVVDATDFTFVADVALSGRVTSVAVRPGSDTQDTLVAVAQVNATTATDPGFVTLHDADGTLLNTVVVGEDSDDGGDLPSGNDSSLPDMVTFTPAGTQLVVANEGEVDGAEDPYGAVSVINVSGDPTAISQAEVVDLNLEALDTSDADTLNAMGFAFDDTQAGLSQDAEPEHVAVTADSQTAFVTLQEVNGVVKIDLVGLTDPVLADFLPLGYVDRRSDATNDGIDDGLAPMDASDRDDAINIAHWPVLGVRQPDGIASYSVDGTDYFVTANEGDDRDDDIVLGDIDLDDAEFDFDGNTEADLGEEAALGRLALLEFLGDTDADPAYEEIYAHGTRSFTIFDEDGAVVFDSGSDLEDRIEELFPFAFNSDEPVGIDGGAEDSGLDARSDDRGPEPEGVTIGAVGSATYAFVGLERMGGVIVYDITDPTGPAYHSYIMGRDLVDYERGVLDWDGDGTLSAGDLLDYETNGGDVGPEGLAFVAADDSPTGRELLLAAHEGSGTVTGYDVGLLLQAPPAQPAVDGVRDLDVDVERTAGPRREDTAIEISKLTYPDGADIVFVATSLNYADALTGGPLAADAGGPILLTVTDRLDPATRGEIQRLDPDEIVVLGGPVAINDSTYAAIEALGVPTTRRIAGENRFETAALINDELTDGGGSDVVFVVEGTNPSEFRGWPDAVSVSAYAAFTGTPIVPVAVDDIPTDTRASLDELAPSEFVIIGGEVAVSADVADDLTTDEDHTVRRLAGENRFETSAAVYDEALTRGLGTTQKWLATGRKFPDALTGGAAAGAGGHSLLLVESENDGLASFEVTTDRLRSAIDTTDVVRLLGGPVAIPEADADDVREIVSLAAPPAAELCLTVLHSNDGESQLVDAGRGIEQFGGAAHFATMVARERDRALDEAANCTDQGVITVTSGDNFLAGPEFSAARDNGVPFYDSLLYDYLDEDAIALGNHDFDFGPPVTNDFIRGFSDDTPFLSANLDPAVDGPLAVQVNLDRLQPSTIVEVGASATKVGIIGLTTPSLPSISSPGDIRILGRADDGTEDLDALAQVVTTQREALEADGAEIIVLISHLQGIDSDISLIERLSGVDLVVAGGGDEILAAPGSLLVPGDETEVFGSYPLLPTDTDGTVVPTVTTAGSYKYLGRVGVRFDADGGVVAVDPDSRMVRVAEESVFDGVPADGWVQTNVVDPVVAFSADLATTVVADTDVPLDGVRQRVRTQETNVGALLADSLARAAEDRAGPAGLDNGLPFVGLANGGGIRNDSVIPAGDVTALDTFDIAPFSNLVAVFTEVSEAELDTLLEHAYGAIEDVDGRFAQLGGLQVEVDPDAAAGERVSSIMLFDNDTQTTSAIPAGGVNLALPDFTARGGDDYPVDDLGDFTVLGLSYQEALAEHLAELGTVSSTLYPNVEDPATDALRIIYPAG